LPKVVDDDLGSYAEAWSAAYSDYSRGMEAALNWTSVPATQLPAPLSGQGWRLGSDNRSDDLFMFLKRRVTGLQPGQAYLATFQVVFATNAGTGCSGIGGSPGEGVIVKAGASALEPQTQISGNWVVMNIDKGNQSQGGAQAVVMGNLANGRTQCDGLVYVLKTLTSLAGTGVPVSADAQGSAWLFVGTDSGFEGRTDVYLTRVTATFTPL
jgi:hypothetical protein